MPPRLVFFGVTFGTLNQPQQEGPFTQCSRLMIRGPFCSGSFAPSQRGPTGQGFQVHEEKGRGTTWGLSQKATLDVAIQEDEFLFRSCEEELLAPESFRKRVLRPLWPLVVEEREFTRGTRSTS